MSGSAGEVVLYRTEDGRDQIQLRAVEGTVWLTQAERAALFDATPQNITQHIRAIYEDRELDEVATCKSYLQVRREGAREVQRTVQGYNLEVILAIGYRVRSPRGVQFRRWANTVLREYLVKGFAMNDAKLKDAEQADYFDELLARIQDIRASEKRFYEKVRELFAASSVDYDGRAATARTFFATIQNKLVYAVTGRTAAELIVERADLAQPNMALNTRTGARVRKTGSIAAKNSLDAREMDLLNRLTVGFLDFAELRALDRQQTAMAEWVEQTDRFLSFNERDVLQGAGGVSRERMEAVIEERFATFALARRAREAEAGEREADDDVAELLRDAAAMTAAMKVGRRG